MDSENSERSTQGRVINLILRNTTGGGNIGLGRGNNRNRIVKVSDLTYFALKATVVPLEDETFFVDFIHGGWRRGLEISDSYPRIVCTSGSSQALGSAVTIALMAANKGTALATNSKGCGCAHGEGHVGFSRATTVAAAGGGAPWGWLPQMLAAEELAEGPAWVHAAIFGGR